MVDLKALDEKARERQLTVSRDPDTFTNGEYAKEVGVSRGIAQKRLALLEADGVIVRARVPMLQGDRVQEVFGWKYVGNNSQSAEKGVGRDRTESVGSDRGRSGEGSGRRPARETVVVTGSSTMRGGGRRATTLRRAETRTTGGNPPRPIIPDEA